MDIREFNEALSASSNGVVVERRQSIILPVLVFLVGVALLVGNCFIENGTDANNLKSALVLIGGAILLVGGALCSARLFGGGSPFHTTDNCFLVRHQYSFDRALLNDVVKAVESGDISNLKALAESDIAGVMVICYTSPNSNFCAMQAFAYEEYVYNAKTALVIK